MAHDFLTEAFVFLAASVVSVLVASRIGLGSVLGYLVAGALIGPFGLGFMGDPEGVMHAAELGVVIMLFLIGLELEPALLWRMRTAILGLGGAQVIVTGALFAFVGMRVGLDWRVSVAIGFILSLSSTAIVMQSLREKGLAATDFGRASFAVLLFQDIAVIPMLALFPLLATRAVASETGALASLPAWAQTLAVTGAIAGIVLAGRVLTRPLFRWIARLHLNEIFTACALALVAGVALLMQSVGLSPALGAFLAGVVLADSEYRHELQSDIEPFRALLLGMFFISVGAGIDFHLLTTRPALIAGLVASLVALKASAMYAIARAFRRPRPEALRIALALAQGGEFAFVLFAFAEGGGIVAPSTADPLVAAVALSMAVTPLLFLVGERAATWLETESVTRETPTHFPLDERPHAIIAGFGRFGQIVHRVLRANGYATSILEHSVDQVETVRGFGNKANYGDASRIDLLRAAGADDAKLLVIAVDDPEKALEIAEISRQTFPHLKILARAFDRAHVYELMKREVDAIERETFEGALRLGGAALRALGWRAHQAERAAGLFRRHDERNLRAMYEHWGLSDSEYRSVVNARRALVEEMLARDLATHEISAPDGAWDTTSLDAEVAGRGEVS